MGKEHIPRVDGLKPHRFFGREHEIVVVPNIVKDTNKSTLYACIIEVNKNIHVFVVFFLLPRLTSGNGWMLS